MASTTVVQHSEELQRAIRWIAEKMAEQPEASSAFLVSEAGPRFNLSPSDQESLQHVIRQQKRQKAE